MIQQRRLAYTAPDPQVDETPGPTVGVGDIRLFTMLLGGAIGATLAATSHPSRGAEQDKWLIFALAAALLGVAAGEAFGFGLSRWVEVKQYHVIKNWRVWLSVFFVLLIAAGLVASTPYLFADSQNLTDNGIALSALAIAGGLPIALTLAAIKQVVADPLPGSAGQQLEILLRLRRMAARMLSQLALLVLLVMGVNAAALDWGIEKQDPNVVIYSGVVASLVVGMMFVPTASTLRKRGAIYVERHFPLGNVSTGQLITAADDRQKLEGMLGLDQTTFGELKAGFVVLTPVIVGLVASLIQRS
jgi:hypothetical protein